MFQRNLAQAIFKSKHFAQSQKFSKLFLIEIFLSEVGKLNFILITLSVF